MSLSATVREYKGKNWRYILSVRTSVFICKISKKWQPYAEDNPDYQRHVVGRGIIADRYSKDNLSDEEPPSEAIATGIRRIIHTYNVRSGWTSWNNALVELFI